MVTEIQVMSVPPGQHIGFLLALDELRAKHHVTLIMAQSSGANVTPLMAVASCAAAMNERCAVLPHE